MQRIEDGEQTTYRFITVGHPENPLKEEKVTFLTYNELIELAEKHGKDASTLKPLGQPGQCSTRDNILRRIEAVENTDCISANAQDLCYWILTGTTQGIFTTGEFLSIAI